MTGFNLYFCDKFCRIARDLELMDVEIFYASAVPTFQPDRFPDTDGDEARSQRRTNATAPKDRKPVMQRVAIQLRLVASQHLEVLYS